jgi:putative nucleotidyltransferase with HDIG domain
MRLYEGKNANALAESLVADVAGLVSPPDICLKLAELVQREDCSVQDIGEVVIRDPNLTAKLLRLVNSPFYGMRGRIDTVSRAITVIGTRELYSLVLAIAAVRSFNGIPNTIVNMDTFWRHSIYTALLSRILAKRCRVLHPERLFVAGLLHDIGCLVLYARLPELARDLLLTAGGDEEALYAAETEVLGFSHAELGALLMRNWQLPGNLIDAVGHHHAPADATVGKTEAAIVHLANVLANRSGIGTFTEEPGSLSAFDVRALTILELDTENLDAHAVTGEAGLQFAETAAALAA